jgi:hypothetical protein
MSIAEKIEEKMLVLESLMDENGKIDSPEEVEVVLKSLSMYWEHMSDDDKDFVEFVRNTLKFNME